MEFVKATFQIALQGGTAPEEAPKALASVLWTQEGKPSILKSPVAPEYDAETGILTWTVPTNCQLYVAVPGTWTSAGVLFNIGTADVDLNTLAPVQVPVEQPQWVSTLQPALTPTTKGTVYAGSGAGVLGLAPPGVSGKVLKTKTDASLGVAWEDETKAEWGGISGAIANQPDLQAALDAKQNLLGYTPVPNTRLINGHALTSDVTLTKSDVGLGAVPNVDCTNPANIAQDSTHRFVTDAEKASWNAPTQWGQISGTLSNQTDLQSALDAKVPSLRTVNGHPLSADVVVTKSDVGLGNVPNVDATNPENISQDALHRFVSDAEKAAWSGKMDYVAPGTAGNVLTSNGSAWVSAPPSGGGGGGTQEASFSFDGVQVARTGKLRWYPPAACTLVSCTAFVDTPPLGSALVVDVNKNGTSVLSSPLSIAAGSNASSEVTPTTTAMSKSDYLTIDVDAIGSSEPGRDLTVRVIYTIP